MECQKTVNICREFVEKTKEQVSRVQGVEESRSRGFEGPRGDNQGKTKEALYLS